LSFLNEARERGSTVTHIHHDEVAIYALVHPYTRERRYVGQSKDIKRRLPDHIRSSKSKATTYKERWIRSLLADGLEPDLEILEVVPPGGDADTQEMWWIAWGRLQGWHLTNAVDIVDGTSYRVSEDERARRSERLHKRYAPRMAEMFPKIVELYREGNGFHAIQKTLRVGTATISKALAEAGIELQCIGRTWKQKKIRDDAFGPYISQIVDEYKAGVAVWDIIGKFGITAGTLYQILRENGVPKRRRSSMPA
jgi:hypothetical protein